MFHPRVNKNGTLLIFEHSNFKQVQFNQNLILLDKS
jgi:hypothetical protein